MRKHALALAVIAAVVGGGVEAADTDSPETRLIQQGYYWQAKAHPERAAEAWGKLLGIAPEQPDGLYGLGLIAVQKKDLDSARRYLGRLQAIQPLPQQALQLDQDIALSPPAQQHLLEQARELSDADKRDEAVAAYRQLLGGRQPQGLIAREYYNTLGYASGGWPEARKGLERLQRQRPDDAVLSLFLALHLARNPDSRPEGIRALAKLSSNPDIGGNADQTWRFALQWLGPPKRDQVVLFQDYLKAHPDDTEIRALMQKGLAQGRGGGSTWRRPAQVSKGLAALDAGDLATAERELTARLAEQPGDFDALGGMGVLRQQQKRLPEAIDYLERATRLPGGGQWRGALNDARYWSLLDQADKARKAGRDGDARRAIDQALALKPKDPAAATALASLQAAQGHTADAEAGYRKVLASAANDPEALAGLIDLLSQTGKPDQALALIDRMSPAQQKALAPRLHIKALRAGQVARLAERRGDLGAAESAYKEALADDPSNAWTRFALARVYLRSGRPQTARELVAEPLAKHPDDVDALYASTLLSAELNEWPQAQRTLAKIPPARRTASISALERDIRLHQVTALAVETARRGQHAAAWAQLDQAAPLAGDKPERIAVLAQAYADAGNPQRAVALMRSTLDRKAAPTPAARLLYGQVLLKADRDAETSVILRDLQGQSLDDSTRRQYDDLLVAYRIKQAQRLREKNDLVAAYDMIAPVLTERPHDVQAQAALASMYAASGENVKARQVYSTLVKNDPNNARLQLGMADIALQGKDLTTAETSARQAVTLEPDVPETLTHAATIYRGIGKSGEAARLLRQAVALEDSQRQLYANAAPIADDTSNPFVGIDGQRDAATDLASTDSVPPPAATAGVGSGFGQAPRQTSAVADTPSPASKALKEIAAERSPYINQGLTVRNSNSEKGLGKLTEVTTPFEFGMPIGDNDKRIALRVTPVSLNAGTPGSNAVARFGTSGTGSVGRQKDTGVGVAVAYKDKANGLTADLGTSPIGFTYTNVLGAIGLNRSFANNPDYRWAVSVSRRAVTDSLTSFAGSRDGRTGVKWGGVTANGVRGELSFDDQRKGAYGYASAHRLVGHNVEDNNRFEVGGGAYWYLINDKDRQLTVGVGGSALHYSENQDYYTYGHGGYFSPQQFVSVNLPVTWAQRSDRFTYKVRGAVGVQHIGQDSADIFPGHSEYQANATAVGLSRYDSQSKTGIGYSLKAAGEYEVTPKVYVGGALGVDNANDYRQFSGALYLRYTFEETDHLDLPVNPYGNPYTPLE